MEMNKEQRIMEEHEQDAREEERAHKEKVTTENKKRKETKPLKKIILPR